jgi:hypothetical protein
MPLATPLAAVDRAIDNDDDLADVLSPAALSPQVFQLQSQSQAPRRAEAHPATSAILCLRLRPCRPAAAWRLGLYSSVNVHVRPATHSLATCIPAVCATCVHVDAGSRAASTCAAARAAHCATAGRDARLIARLDVACVAARRRDGISRTCVLAGPVVQQPVKGTGGLLAQDRSFSKAL